MTPFLMTKNFIKSHPCLIRNSISPFVIFKASFMFFAEKIAKAKLPILVSAIQSKMIGIKKFPIFNKTADLNIGPKYIFD